MPTTMRIEALLVWAEGLRKAIVHLGPVTLNRGSSPLSIFSSELSVKAGQA
jgi:hypothetical protein